MDSLDQPRLQALARGVIAVDAVVLRPALSVAAKFDWFHSDFGVLLDIVQVVELRRLVGLELLQFHHVDAVATLAETDVSLDALFAILVVAAGQVVSEPVNFEVRDGGSANLVGRVRLLAVVALSLLDQVEVERGVSLRLRLGFVFLFFGGNGVHALLVCLTIASAVFDLKLAGCSYMKGLHNKL